MARQLEIVGAFLEETSSLYADLAARVDRFVGQDRGWGALDVAGFVRAQAQTRAERVALCCNLAALLSMVVDSGLLPPRAARRIWVDLRQACPRTPAAERYFDLGESLFALRESVPRPRGAA